MYISKILKEMGIPHICKNEQRVSSLGLVEYNDGKDVCTFVDNEYYLEKLSDNIQMVLIGEDLLDTLKQYRKSYGICVVENPRLTYFRIHNYLVNDISYRRTDFKTRIGTNCNISSQAVIAGCKIAGEGFEFKNTSEEVFHVSHIGGVIIGESVEIQYNTCIDKAIYPWDNTVIGDHVKIDNLVHIGHAVKVDSRTMIVANSGIGGRVSIGEDVWIGFGATIRNGIHIGDRARTNMGSVVTRNVGTEEAVTGNFAIPHKDFIANLKK